MKEDLAGGSFPSGAVGANAAWWQIMFLDISCRDKYAGRNDAGEAAAQDPRRNWPNGMNSRFPTENVVKLLAFPDRSLSFASHGQGRRPWDNTMLMQPRESWAISTEARMNVVVAS
jgi:hypothetical protein